MSTDGLGTNWRRNIAENFDSLCRVHERYRQTDRRLHIANVNLSSRSLKTLSESLGCQKNVLKHNYGIVLHSGLIDSEKKHLMRVCAAMLMLVDNIRSSINT